MEVFLDCLYRIPLKWEPEGPVVAWCCSHILCGPHRGIGLLRKGVAWDLMAKGPEQVEWSKWLPKTALNARMVMSAYLPSLAHQSVWHATTLPEVLQNFRSIFMGVGALDYPDAWWKQTLKSAIRTLHLGDHITVSMWTSWVQLGRHWTVLWSSHKDACYPALPAAHTCNGLTEGGWVGVIVKEDCSPSEIMS